MEMTMPASSGPSRVVGLVRHRSIVNLAWRFMTDEAHAMRRKIQIGLVGRGVQGLVRRPENLGPYGAAADRAACLLVDLLDYAEKVNKLGVRLAQNAQGILNYRNVNSRFWCRQISQMRRALQIQLRQLPFHRRG